MSVQNNESETPRKKKATARFRKLTAPSGNHGATMLKDDPLTKLVARLIEAWVGDGRHASELAGLFGTSASNVSQIKSRTLGVGNLVGPRIAKALSVSTSELHKIAEIIERTGESDITPLVARLAGDKRAALPWLALGEELSVGERAVLEDALKLIEAVRSSGKLPVAMRKDADAVLSRAREEASRSVPPPPPTRPVKRHK